MPLETQPSPYEAAMAAVALAALLASSLNFFFIAGMQKWSKTME